MIGFFRRGVPFVGTLSILLVLAPASRADGTVTGHITVPQGVPVAEIKVVLVPQNPRSMKRPAKIGKNGDYFFRMVTDGRYTLAFEGTTLVAHSIKLVVTDIEKHSDLINFEGMAPSEPQAFDVNINLKVTYDVTLGPAERSPAAMQTAQATLQEVPALLQAGDYKSALEKVDAALRATPDDSTARYFRALILFKTKDYDGAQAEVAKVLELNPDQIGVHWLQGAILASTGRKQEAVSAFEKEIANTATDPPTKVNCYINIGLIERELNRREAAIAAFEKVLELDSNQAEAYSYLAELYLASGKPEKAAEIEARSRSVGAEDANAMYNLGATYWNNKQFDKAEEYFRRATELNPKLALAWQKLGYALVREGKGDEAVASFKKYLELTPGAEDSADVRQLIDALGKKD